MDALIHLMNCHGEWTIWAPMVLSCLDGLPYIGTWLSWRNRSSDEGVRSSS